MRRDASGFAARSWAEIDLPAIDRNVGRIKQALPARIRYVAVVKADAYGHGMPEVASRLLQAGVDCFAVANVSEAARRLRGSRSRGGPEPGWPRRGA